MVNEADDKYEEHDEGEYHFSDENTSYELDNDVNKNGDVAVIKQSFLSKLGKYQRIVIATFVFVVLMIIIYKLLTPSDLSAPTEISQNNMDNSSPKVESAVVAVTSKPPKPSVSYPAAAAPSAPMVQQPLASSQTVAASPPVMQQTPASPPSQGVVQQGDNIKDVTDRLAALEQQNAKLSNVLQIEYAQKIADADTQNATTQAKLKDLSTRVANMEATLTQITQLLQGNPRTGSMAAIPTAKSNEPKQVYTVQAIIPGRAWLKSDSGETVTVAEGDMLRDYGRVTKIDPYDGVVDIDTGNKILSLSYGAGSD